MWALISRQPPIARRHRNVMRGRIVSLLLSAAILGSLAACSPNQSPDEIRRKTAEDTAALKRDSKAVAEGVKEGLSGNRSVDLNKASREDLSSLPGISSEKADRIIAERPYANAHQLVTRHVLSEEQYAQIQDRVVVAR